MNDLISRYQELEDELAEIAMSLGKTAAQLTSDYLEQPEAIRMRLRPILWSQLKYLDLILESHYAKFENVSVFPVARGIK